mmetsp:Transcript_26480/g.71604  ORF Transcript_26480/g.71604 Transcript_26480/m.71604 type:complete len:120 (-) Transcript_26480:772-1131(-)
MGLSREFTHLIQERIKRAYSKTADSQPMILYKQAHAIEVLNTPSLTACKHYHYCPFTHYRFARKVSFSISMVTVPHSRALGAPAAAAAAAVEGCWLAAWRGCCLALTSPAPQTATGWLG